MYGCDCEDCKRFRTAEVPDCGCGKCAPAAYCTNCAAPLVLRYESDDLKAKLLSQAAGAVDRQTFMAFEGIVNAVFAEFSS